jgi:hypothetical protein
MIQFHVLHLIFVDQLGFVVLIIICGLIFFPVKKGSSCLCELEKLRKCTFANVMCSCVS